MEIAPSIDLPEQISSLIRVKVITLASTPMPTARITPAIPGRVRVKEDMNPKKPEIAAIDTATWPIRAKIATTPGRRKKITI